MLEKISLNLANYFFNKHKIDKDEIEVYAYGLEILLSSIFSITCSILIGISLNKTIEAMIFLMVYCSIRKQAGGYHADTNFSCISTFLIIFTSAMIVVPNLPTTNSMLIMFILLLCNVLIICLAPVGTIENPIPENKKKIMNKKAVVLTITYSLIIIITFFSNSTIRENYTLIGVSAICFITSLMIIGYTKNLLRRKYL